MGVSTAFPTRSSPATKTSGTSIRANSTTFAADVRLTDGDTIRAGSGVNWEVLARPGHSRSDTLFVDHAAGFGLRRRPPAGRHLLQHRGRPGRRGRRRAPARPRTEYLRNLRRTAALPLDVLYAGHGRPVNSHRALVDVRIAEHAGAAARIAATMLDRPQTAFGIAKRLWPEKVTREQPLLVVWEVLGHLELVRPGSCSSPRTTMGPNALPSPRNQPGEVPCWSPLNRPSSTRKP